ncbi:MAG: NAD(P)-binding protein [Deltaproteobacteria bacterium]|nr:NAD(P)-binding protein [Deltaproteobacteria bacterium]
MLGVIFWVLYAQDARSASADTARKTTRYPIKVRKIASSANLLDKVTVHGGKESGFDPKVEGDEVKDDETYDAIVVGGGLGGLSAGVYLTDHGKRVLLLEKESAFGGLAMGGMRHGVRYDRGAAYWTDTYEEEGHILTDIGMGDWVTENKKLHAETRKKYAIHEPADSFYWNGNLYLGIWEEDTMEKLPASFSVFHHMLKAANDKGLIPNQPFEEADNLSLDELSAAEWIRIMPVRLREEAEKGDKVAAKLHSRFLKDPKVNHDDPMGDVIGLMELYCRSALGSTPDQVSAVAFANFYISEIDTRYTTPMGTGSAAEHMVKILKGRPDKAIMSAGSKVTKIVNFDDHVVVSYVRGGKTHDVQGKYAVFAAQLKLAPMIVEGLAGTEQGAYMESLGYADYSVHAVFVKGHPFRATYDTWTRAKDYTSADFTDVILGRWMDPKIHGYEGIRGLVFDKKGNARFKHPAPDKDGVLTIYHPLPPNSYVRQDQDKEEAVTKEIAAGAVDRLLQLWPPSVNGKKWGTKITEADIEAVETSRWPYSVHVARPGHFKRAKAMRKPFKRTFFANNNLGTPAFEEALFRGHCAADNILKRLDDHFEFEKWSKCPLEE